jgi:hypothetical protein
MGMIGTKEAPMSENLSTEELAAMVQRVFRPTEKDTALAILVDLPDEATPDNPQWKQRREMAADWARRLTGAKNELGLETHLVLYRNPRMNNADLPAEAWIHDGDLPASADELDPGNARPLGGILAGHSILIAPTEFSATAPLKLTAREHGFRAATMPGFQPEMIPSLRLDYGEINRRVQFMKNILDRSARAEIVFRVDDRDDHRLTLDLRHRQAHASGGLFPDTGVAGNLPSGETYIVPYEGEVEGDPSTSNGELPVQFGEEVVVFSIRENKAVEATGPGAAGKEQVELLQKEPAYGNMAELGLGVLADFGIEPTGSVLLDEKLGLHIAFGRSDHFGGQVGAAQFNKPEAVVHIDRVYIPKLQPRVMIKSADLIMEDGSSLALMKDGEYVIEFG